MSGMINQLVDIMNEQAERYNELLGLTLEEKDVLVQNDAESLQKITNLKNIVITQNNRLERKRLSLTKDIAEVMGYGNTDLDLTQLIELMIDQPEAEELEAVGVKLRDIIGKLKEAGEVNRLLLESALEYADYTLNMIRSSIEPELAEFPAKYGGIDSAPGSFDATR